MDHSSKQVNVSYVATIWSAFASVGWYALAAIISLWCAFPYIQGKYASWKLRRNEEEYAAKYHKNPDLLQERLSALEASRQRMQEKYLEKCLLVQHEKKEEKGKMKNGSVSVSGEKLSSDGPSRNDSDRASLAERRHKSMKGEYNPLNGDGSRGYRSPKRSCCGKGGCG